MRKAILLLFAAVLLISCENNKNYTINGVVTDTNYEGKKVYVQELTNSEMVVVDTAIIVNGAFTFKGSADSTVLRFVSLDESVDTQNLTRIPVLLEPGVFEVKFDSVVTVTGTPVNQAYTDYRVKQRELNQKARSIIDQYNAAASDETLTDSLEAEINDAYDKISKENDDLNYSFVNDNIGNDLGKYIFSSQWRMFSPEQQKEFLEKTDDNFKSMENIQRMIKRIENYERVAVGKKFVDFTLKDPQGKEVSLSNYAGNGKYVLVDFWAAWCGPCVEEMPNVLNAYNKYKSKGFEVVGVSLDRDEAQWKKGLKDLKMTWPQMSDLNYWDSPVVELYAIESIPHTVLLDKDGTILEKNLRGKALDDKLAELMN